MSLQRSQSLGAEQAIGAHGRLVTGNAWIRDHPWRFAAGWALGVFLWLMVVFGFSPLVLLLASGVAGLLVGLAWRAGGPVTLVRSLALRRH